MARTPSSPAKEEAENAGTAADFGKKCLSEKSGFLLRNFISMDRLQVNDTTTAAAPIFTPVNTPRSIDPGSWNHQLEWARNELELCRQPTQGLSVNVH